MATSKLPEEIVIPEYSYHAPDAEHPKPLSSYMVEDLIFIYDWSSNEIIYEGNFRSAHRLPLRPEFMPIFGRKMMRGYNYLQFGINKQTHALTLRLA